MDSVSIINKILDANGFYCYKASKRSVAIVKSSRMPEIKLGDIVKTVNNISTMSMTQSVLASTMQTKLNSVEIFSPGQYHIFFPSHFIFASQTSLRHQDD